MERKSGAGEHSKPPFSPWVGSGDFVVEKGSDLRGHVIGPGEYPGEWRIMVTNGSETTCLAENLEVRSHDDEHGSGRA